MTTTEIQAVTANIRKRAIALVTLSAALYGLLGYFGTKLIEQQFSINAMLFWRFLIAMLWIVLVGLKDIKRQPKIDISIGTFCAAVLFGAMAYAGGSGFYFMASEYAGTGLAMVIFFAYPLFIVIFAWLMENYKIKKNTVIAMTAILIGLLLLASGHGIKINITGVLWALLAALSYAIYFYGSKFFTCRIPAYLQTILICAGCSVIFLLLALYNHSFVFPTTLSAWLYIAAIGIIATALPIQLLLEGLKHIHPNKASLLSAFEPVVTLFVGIIMLGETVSVLQFIGALIIIVGAVCVHE